MAFQVENPIQLGDWDNDLRTLAGSNFFHTAAWAAVFVHAYGYRPAYITQRKGHRLAALLPVMEINSLLTGKRGVSLPFTDFCQPLAANTEQLKDLVVFALQQAVKKSWQSLVFRTCKPLPFLETPAHQYRRHRLALDGSCPGVEKKLRKSTLRNVKRAIRSGVHVSVLQNLSSIRTFYGLNCHTRKRHGLPPQPWYFFEAVHEHVIKPQKGHVFLAFFEDRPIAGAIFFHYRNQAFYKYGASDRRYQQHRANNLVIWEAIQHYRASGCRMIDFGRTEPSHEGLLQFKRGWGAEEDRLYYYQYNTKQLAFRKTPSPPKPGYRILKHLPIALLRLAGHILYRHVG